MIFKFFYISSLTLIIVSCAQLGDISGGKKDTIAPKIVECNPPNKSTNFNTKKIEFVFNEYFKLNNPNDNAIILPIGVKLNVSYKKKKMVIEWEEDLLPNTSYQINMNSLVQDITESNDSLMSYVFSTGNYIDSLSLSGTVISSENNEAQSGWTVFLNTSEDIFKNKPTYFSKTNSKGEYKIENIKNGKYFLYALKDDNKDLLFQITESIAFHDTMISILDTNKINIELKSFMNKEHFKIKTKQYIKPNLLILKTTFPIFESSLKLNSNVINKENITTIKEDSAFIFIENTLSNDNHNLIFSCNEITDTSSFFVPNKEAKISYYIFPTDKNLTKSKEAEFYFNSAIKDVDSKYILCTSIDSLKVPFKFNFEKNKIKFFFPDTLTKNITLEIKKEAITFKNGQENKEIKNTFIIKNKKDLCVLKLKNQIPDDIIIELKNNNNLVLIHKELIKENGIIENIEPGEYKVKAILDNNKNRKWDTGDFTKKQQPENIIFFTDKIKLRANWETEVEIDFELKTIK